jgi:opacity protein-like surface antigen
MTRCLMLLPVLVVGLAGVASASVQQGDTELNFLGSYQSWNGDEASDQDTLSLAGGLGYFVTDNLEVGGEVGVNWLKEKDEDGDYKTTAYSLGASAKYHFMPKNQCVPYVGAQIGYLYLDVDSPDDEDDGKYDGLEYGPLAGLRFELNESNDFFVEYRYTLFSGDYGDAYDGAHQVFFGIIHQFNK